MGMATGSYDDGCAVVVSEILICRMRHTVSYPTNIRTLIAGQGASRHPAINIITYGAR